MSQGFSLEQWIVQNSVKIAVFSTILLFVCILSIGIAAFLHWRNKKEQELLAKKMQKKKEPIYIKQTPTKAFVRATDIIKLTPEQEKLKKHAYDLVAKGQVIEGAEILEKLNLHRFAISALEKNGYIQEAADVLMRLQRPNRAAAIFQRNGLHAKAAEYFILANMEEEAAQEYMQAGKSDKNYYMRAALLYEKLDKKEEALHAYMEADAIDKIHALTIELNAWEKFTEYLCKHSHKAKEILTPLTSEQIKIFVKSLAVDTNTAQAIAFWVNETRRLDLAGPALTHLSQERASLQTFWSMLDKEIAYQIAGALIRTIRSNLNPTHANKFFVQQARALYEVQNYALAGEMYLAAKRYLMAAKCAVLIGKLEACLKFLIEAKETQLAQECENILKNSSKKNGGWPEETIKACQEIMRFIDPDNDEGHTSSPFSLSA